VPEKDLAFEALMRTYLANKSIEPTGGSRFCLSAIVSQWRLTPVAHARRWADMRHTAISLLIAFLLTGCSSPHSRVPDTARNAMARVHVGMTESELLELMRPVSIDWGCVYIGGSGSRRFYFQISPTRQVWYAHTGYHSNFKLDEIAQPEPKTTWTRRTNDSPDSIVVEGMQW
jgi:hypothetical protein